MTADDTLVPAGARAIQSYETARSLNETTRDGPAAGQPRRGRTTKCVRKTADA